MKTLPKTLRSDYRYLRVKIDPDTKKDFQEVIELVKRAIREFSGEKGLSKSNPYLIKQRFDFEDQEAVIRINRASEKMVRAAITLSKIKMITLNVSGTQESV